ncbi:MAG: class I SAM-dependent methyltransferase [Saccharothrix sp.]|nr:class I SAM-dependent methyltransferase [Saccharothrix sp.]
MEFDVVAELVVAAGGRDDDIARVIGSAGSDLVARVVLDEIAHRFEHPPTRDAGETVVQVSLAHDGGTAEWLLRVDAEKVHYEPGRVDAPEIRVEQDLVEVVRAVYGPAGAAANSTRKLDLRGSGDMRSFIQPPAWFRVAQRLVAATDARDGADLTELAGRYGTDKWGIHRYTPHYERYFEPLRDRPLTLLEIGVGGLGSDDPAAGGASLRMWKHYFPRALVYGIDIVDKQVLSEQRLTVLQADQSDPADLAAVVERTGPLDIVIDDGSHRSADVLTSFRALFPHVRPGGWYVVEDVQTAYWPRFGGRSDDLADPTTSTGFLKALVDGLNHQEVLAEAGRPPGEHDLAVKGVHFHHNVVFVEKGLNAEPGGPDWVRYGPR